MKPDIAALVDVQTDDLAIHELERGVEQLMPKVNALNAEVAKAKTAVDQATQLAEAEEKRKRDVLQRIDAPPEGDVADAQVPVVGSLLKCGRAEGQYSRSAR